MKKNDVDVTQEIKALSRSLSESVVSVSLLTRDGGMNATGFTGY